MWISYVEEVVALSSASRLSALKAFQTFIRISQDSGIFIRGFALDQIEARVRAALGAS
jgi:hypothetical protein